VFSVAYMLAFMYVFLVKTRRRNSPYACLGSSRQATFGGEPKLS
jgi:formate hydrogenlyase subunit 4